MASESSEKLAQQAPVVRRTDTPPRSIFDNYQSAYQSILSPARTFTGHSNLAGATSSEASSGLSLPNNPLADLSPPTRAAGTPSHGTQTGIVTALKGKGNSRLPSSPKSKRKPNFSRPMSKSSLSDRVTRPADTLLRDSVSILDLGSPRRLSNARKPNTKQPNLHGARGRVEKASTLGSIVRKYGDEPDSTRKSGVVAEDVEVRSPRAVLASGQGILDDPNILRSSPAGQAPTIPLPPLPSRVAPRGPMGETFSEGSLYENTEKLLNLTQASVEAALPGGAATRQPPQAADNLEGRLDSEFSWMGSKGKASFRDLSTKEMKLRRSIQGRSRGTTGESGDVSPFDDPDDDQVLPDEAVYQRPTAAKKTTALDALVRDDARRAHILSRPVVSQSSRNAPKEVKELAGPSGQNLKAVAGVSCNIQTASDLDFGGLQSSSSRGVSLEDAPGDSLHKSSPHRDSPYRESPFRDSPFRPGLYMDESSLISLVGREDAEATRLSALASGKSVIRSEDNDAEGDVCTPGDENDGEEWETVGESGLRKELRTQPSMGRDTSGSSLANVSSNVSNESNNDRAAPSMWDPLRSHPILITPPTKAVIHQRNANISGVQEPATVPRYFPAHTQDSLPQKLHRTSSSTSAIPFTATPQNRRDSQMSPSYRHPTPLSGQHRNPFLVRSPTVDLEIPGQSYELSDFSSNHRVKNQAIYSGSRHSRHQQISTPTRDRAQHRQENPFATQDTRSNKSLDGSYSTFYPANPAMEGSSILNPTLHHTPKSAKSFTPGSLRRTKTFLTGSPRGMLVSLVSLNAELTFFSRQNGGIPPLPKNP
jgi:hypothetical protein